jgi:hypothetical protein
MQTHRKSTWAAQVTLSARQLTQSGTLSPDQARQVRMFETLLLAQVSPDATDRESHGQVDLPHFVTDLINGVFQAIVDSSIQQMEAYAQMIAAVTKGLDQFVKDDCARGNC